MTKSVLEDGRYTILNVGSKNAAQLATSNEGQKVQASAKEGATKFYWQATKLANGNYLLQNVGAGNYAYVEDDAAVNTKVVGSSSKREWVINGTGTTDIYTIAPSFARSHYWGVDDDGSGAIVKLESGKSDDNNNWEIKSA